MEKTLIIMAAGMGSRFGGLKQIEPVGPSKEIIADYSIYDAIRAGFTKLVFIIQEKHLDYFEKNISVKFGDKIKVEYVFQKLDNVIPGTKVPENREKMWGTGHALYSAIEVVDGPFMLINADDFYGRDAFMKISQFFDDNKNDREYLMITYPFESTINNASVIKRGLCIQNGTDISVVECEITKEDNEYIARALVTGKKFKIEKDHPTNMNCFGFKKDFLELVRKDFEIFCAQELDEKVEFLLTETLRKSLESKEAKIYLENSCDNTLGITYPEDLPVAKEKILKLIEEGIYPLNLWEK
ncbi:MAG: nucleotidyltransferase [Firmicutes bacterium]|nr:nucleotidyltransferase [Bacillota bacterium]